ncbi:uncharacterized protein LOC109835498 [Asparagus officinalis]|uniref:uncharacterized protein LOC109835498 n=1 Tax=Asparagus officinalis TaxID=4686 RepID=UPI00098E3262|nr:uncharacterized protein LOC109835498 [Asparagus officinalis]
MIAEYWITEIEKVFTYMRCPEEEKVDYAVYMLKECAYGWWQIQYFPSTVRKQKEQEFRKLEQCDKTVAEYEEEFTYLSKFATHLLGKEEDRARRFKEGLRPDIRKVVSAFELPTYGEVLQKALLIKKNEIDTKPKNETSSSYPKKRF